MSAWRNILSYMSGGASRDKGTQITGPGSYATAAATPVTLDSAMQLSAVWSCIRIIAETIGSLPINIYKVADDGTRTLFPDHPLAILFRNKVNRWQTRQEYLESIVFQIASQGNDYSAIQRNGQGDIISLVPLMTPQMVVELQDSGSILYQYTDGGILKFYSDKTIWHNKLFGNAIVGISPLAYARNSIGVGQAAEQSVTKIYKNGGKPSGLLMIDKVLTPEQRDKIKANFSALAEGGEDRLFVLEADMRFEKVSLSPQDIELLASRRFQIEDICRFFGVPSVLVNDTSASTTWGSGIEQIIQGFYKFTIRPYLERYEASMRCNLLTPEQRDTVDIAFDFDALLNSNFSERVKAGKEAVTGGLMTPNQWRATEGFKPLPGGDSLYMQQQMVPLEMLDKIARPVPGETQPQKASSGNAK